MNVKNEKIYLNSAGYLFNQICIRRDKPELSADLYDLSFMMELVSGRVRKQP
jgi:hypothetical protein